MTKHSYIGKVFKTNNYGDVVITKYINNREVHFRFVDTGYETKTSLRNIITGKIKDRMMPSVYGIGVIGDQPSRLNNKITKEYTFWSKMLCRCYDYEFRKKFCTYADCSVSDNFKYFPYFKDWCHKQVGFNNDKWQLDKDILIKGNKIYSEDTCVFVPKEVNMLLCKSNKARGSSPIGVFWCKKARKYASNCNLGSNTKHLGSFTTELEAFLVYKQAKERYIKVVANKWKDQIDIRAYEALMKYEVEITD